MLHKVESFILTGVCKSAPKKKLSANGNMYAEMVIQEHGRILVGMFFEDAALKAFKHLKLNSVIDIYGKIDSEVREGDPYRILSSRWEFHEEKKKKEMPALTEAEKHIRSGYLKKGRILAFFGEGSRPEMQRVEDCVIVTGKNGDRVVLDVMFFIISILGGEVIEKRMRSAGLEFLDKSKREVSEALARVRDVRKGLRDEAIIKYNLMRGGGDYVYVFSR